MATASDVISIAQKEIGTVETGTNMNPYGKELGQDGVPWCGLYVCWCLIKAGMEKPSFNYASAAAYAYAAEHSGWGTYHKADSGYAPCKGDLFIRNYNGDDYSANGHVGFVASDAENGYFVSNEGNAGANADRVYSDKKKSVQGLCFVTPPYDDAGTVKETFTANWVERELPNLTSAQMASKTYERYQMVKNTESANYKLLNSSEASTNEHGFRIYKDKYYMIALGTYYGSAGTWVKLQFGDGTVIHAVMGDEKSDAHTDSKHMYHVQNGINFLEIIVDADKITSQSQFLEKCDNTGIPSKSPVVKIWTSDTEPQYSKTSGSDSDEKSYNFSGTDSRIPLHPKLFNLSKMICNDDVKMTIGDAEHNVTAYMGDLSWSNTRAELATTMSFSLAKNDAKYNKEFMYLPNVGDIVRYGTDSEKFRGVILDIDDGDRFANKYTAADAGWYMNKSSDTYQFTEQRADECLKFILSRKFIPIAELPVLDTKITQIYIDKTLSDVIKDILDKCGGGYNFDFIPEGIRIYKNGAHEAKAIYKPAFNVAEIYSKDIRGPESHKISMENIITGAKVINDTDVLTVAQNSRTLSQFGHIQTIVKKSEDDDPVALARSTVENGSILDETYSFDIIEQINGYTRAGDSMVINNIKYIIDSAAHSISKGIHHVNLTLLKAENAPMYKNEISAVVVTTEKETSNNADIENSIANTPTGKKIIVLDPGHGISSGSMSSDLKINSGYVYNASKGAWGEWRHFKTGTWGNECAGSGCNGSDHWYSIGNGDRDTEPELNLNNALAAKKYLEQMGYVVRISRTSNNENPSFTKRAANAFANGDSSNSPDAECIVCIHSNAGGGKGSAYIALGSGYGQKYIKSDYAAQSNALGKKINDRITYQTSLGAYSNGCAEGMENLILFHKSPVPVAYMEIGFYDNSSDLSILKSEADKIGRAIAEGVDDWIKGV